MVKIYDKKSGVIMEDEEWALYTLIWYFLTWPFYLIRWIIKQSK